MADFTDAHRRDLLPLLAAGLLDGEEHDRVTRHLTTCTSCRRELSQWQAISTQTHTSLQQAQPATSTAASWQRLQASLAPEQPLNGKHTTDRGDRYMEFGNQSAPVTTTDRHNPSRRPILALAAAVLIASLGIASFMLFSTKPIMRKVPLTGPSASATTTNVGTGIPPVYLTPGTLVTPGPSTAIPISNVTTSTSAANNAGQLQLSPATALFAVGDTINVSFKVQGAKANDVISVKWYMNGTDLTPMLKETQAACCSKTMTDDKVNSIIFALQVPSPGLGKAEIYYNATLADTVLFDVVTQAQLTTPSPTATASH